MQYIEAICYGGEFVTIVTLTITVLIIAGEVSDGEADFQLSARRHCVGYQVNTYQGLKLLRVGDPCAENECNGHVAKEHCDQNESRFFQTHSTLPYFVP